MTKLPKKFTAKIIKSPNKGGWTYVIWPESVAFFGTRGLVKVSGKMDNHAFQSAFMPLGNGQHKLPVKREILEAVGKKTGDSIEVLLENRL